MYKWRINITLKNGIMKHCLYECSADTSENVFKGYFEGAQENAFISLSSEDKKAQCWIKVGDISCIDIGVF